ncbi:gluconokinase [Pedobacter aquatilis]|uniref:gluconokinase n=1 Tax=Pedobacter aquatilis TaxID=351343 RepID=UPI0029312C62|nr:FGGY family carbohydrate kinase [Pedobacter aquatilis]
MAMVLSIDLGTTNLKIGLIGSDGKPVQWLSAPCPVNTKQDGTAQHSPEELKSLITGLIKRLLALPAAGEITHIISSSYQFGLMLLDKDRNALTGLTLLSDTRAQRTFEAFKAKFSDLSLYERTGCPLITPYALPRLFYFRAKEARVFRKAKYICDSKSFLFEWLTGAFVTDISTAAASQCLKLETLGWDDELLCRLGLQKEQFPAIENGMHYNLPLLEAHCTAFGLNSNVKVFLGLYDGAALGYGLNGFSPNSAVINLGTSAMLRIVGKRPIFDITEDERIQPYAIGEKLFFNGGALNNAALTLNWLKDNIFDSALSYPDLSGANPNPALICLPYLSGERDVKTGPYASGVFFGLKNHHSRIDLYRAVLEGVAYSMKYLLDALWDKSINIDRLYMGGGGAQIKAWPQIFANILGLPIIISKEEQMALIGNALICFKAEGIAVESAVGLGAGENTHMFIPDLSKSSYHKRTYSFFKSLRETLAPLYQKHMEL